MNISRHTLAIALGLTLTLSACERSSTQSEPPASAASSQAEQAPAERHIEQVAEAFQTALTPDDNIDSLAAWHHPDGAVWVFATAKSTDQLLVYDGITGETLRTFGQRGDGAGQFKRPNGVLVADDLLFVIERDNARVQVLRLPGFEHVASFGSDVLIKPYGGWVHKTDAGYQLYVTDAYSGADDGLNKRIPAPLSALDKRIKHFSLSGSGTQMQASLVRSFGDTTELGALRVVESLWGDAANNRLLIAEEDEDYSNEIKVYDLDGKFTGQIVGKGVFQAQVEGLSLKTCPDGSGWWIGTQQGKDHSVFHLFDRNTLEHVNSFRGDKTANTDGIWLDMQASERFPLGALYAVHDDQGMSAFDWRNVRSVMLLPKCQGE